MSFFTLLEMKIRAIMVDDRHLVLARILLLLMGIAAPLMVGGALEEMDEALYQLLSSQMEPPPACPEHEVYLTCSGNCSDCARRGNCRADCSFKGCDCFHNYARMGPEGQCQPVHLCPKPECGENEVFRECGAVCERCGGTRCRLLQCEHRCYCAEGHLRDEGERCVPKEQCPHRARCFRDEEMGSSGRVDEYCLRDEATSNATETRDRCYCREGFSRNTIGLCVRDELCEKVLCPGAEVYQSCPRKCNVTCRGDSGDCEEDGKCFPGCFCPEGYLVDDFRRCVPEHHCPTGSSTPAPTTGPTESSTPLIPTTEVQVSSSNETCTTDEEEILELTEEEYGGTTAATSPSTTTADETTPSTTTTDETTPSTTTADETTPSTTTTVSTQGGIETSRSSATTTTDQGGKRTTTTAAPRLTVQETTMVDDATTTFETKTRADNAATAFETTSMERRRDDVDTTTTAVVTTCSSTTATRPSEENDF